jgi:hypothetical protein
MAEILSKTGTTAQNTNYKGKLGEMVIDNDKKTIIIHDGTQVGGYELVNTSGSQTITGTKTFSSIIIPALGFATTHYTGANKTFTSGSYTDIDSLTLTCTNDNCYIEVIVLGRASHSGVQANTFGFNIDTTIYGDYRHDSDAATNDFLVNGTCIAGPFAKGAHTVKWQAKTAGATLTVLSGYYFYAKEIY